MLSLVRNSAADRLTSSFEYKLPATASYIKERHCSCFHPLGSNIYQPTAGTRLLRFVISDGTAFLDPSTARLAFTLNNTTPLGTGGVAPTGGLKLAGPPLVLFKRIRVLVKGTPVEVIEEAGRLSTLLTKLDCRERVFNNEAESFWQTPRVFGESRRILTDLNIIGLFRLDKHLSLHWAPITLKLELADGIDAFEGSEAAAVGAAKRTQAYSLTDCSILCDTLVVSAELQRLFAEHMVEGKMPLAISSWSNTRHEVPTTGKFDLQTTRSLALLKTVFVTFDAPPMWSIARVTRPRRMRSPTRLCCLTRRTARP